MLALFDELDEFQRRWRVFKPRPDLRDEMEARYRAALADPDARLFVAMDGSDVVGMALGQMGRPSKLSDELALELSSFIVLPSHRRSGVGRALARAIGRFARARGLERVTLGTYADNDGALNFWKSLGFQARTVSMTVAAEDL